MATMAARSPLQSLHENVGGSPAQLAPPGRKPPPRTKKSLKGRGQQPPLGPAPPPPAAAALLSPPPGPPPPPPPPTTSAEMWPLDAELAAVILEDHAADDQAAKRRAAFLQSSADDATPQRPAAAAAAEEDDEALTDVRLTPNLCGPLRDAFFSGVPEPSPGASSSASWEVPAATADTAIADALSSFSIGALMKVRRGTFQVPAWARSSDEEDAEEEDEDDFAEEEFPSGAQSPAAWTPSKGFVERTNLGTLK